MKPHDTASPTTAVTTASAFPGDARWMEAHWMPFSANRNFKAQGAHNGRMLVSAQGGDDMGAAGLAATGWFLCFALFPLFNRDRLRAGDLIAGTWVVEMPRRKLEAALSTGAVAASGTSQTTGAQYRFGEAELAVYGEYELQTLERVLREDRAEAMVKVHEAICRKIGWEPGAGDERAFLEAYYTQLRARLESGMGGGAVAGRPRAHGRPVAGGGPGGRAARAPRTHG